MRTINNIVSFVALMTVGCGAVPDDAASSGEADASEVGITQELFVTDEGTIVQDGTVTGDAAPQEVQTNLLRGQCSVSFIDSCRGWYVRWEGMPVVSARATSCRRRDGTWTTWQPQYHGRCYTDVSNVDGTLLCAGG